MQELTINYSDQPVEEGGQSIFLAGPTARSQELSSWRGRAVEILEKLGFTGRVYIPERRDDPNYDYVKQLDWEWDALHAASVIVFWVPRHIDPSLKSLGMPGFTTNVEFGFHLQRAPEKIVYGRPKDSQKNRYLDAIYKKQTGREPMTDLESTLMEAVKRLPKIRH